MHQSLIFLGALIFCCFQLCQTFGNLSWCFDLVCWPCWALLFLIITVVVETCCTYFFLFSQLQVYRFCIIEGPETVQDWAKFTKDYFLNRSTLVSVFLLIDASIPAKPIDLEYASWLGQNQVCSYFSYLICWVIPKSDGHSMTLLLCFAHLYLPSSS